MNWLFGSKRKSPEVFISHETPEGFTAVTATRPTYESPLPPYPPIPRPDAVPAAPYPYLAQYPPAPVPSYVTPTPTYGTPASPYQAPTSSIGTPVVTNPLDSVPFILAPSLLMARTRSTTEFDSYRAQMTSLKDKLETIYTYDFTLERSVIQEHTNGL